jgi:ADP-ribosylglycohydrolase
MPDAGRYNGGGFDTLEETLSQAESWAVVEHNHPEGMKGAEMMVAATFLAGTRFTQADM